MENILKIKTLREKAVLPTRATEGSAGIDICACIEEPVTIKPGELKMIPSGIAIELGSRQQAAFLFARSGLGVKHGITLANGVGVIDSDYRGEVCVGLCNVSSEEYTIQPGERIAQLVIMPVVCPEIMCCEELSDTARGEGALAPAAGCNKGKK